MINVKFEDAENLDIGPQNALMEPLVKSGLRRVKISTNTGTIDYPTKAVNRNDLNAKNRVPEIDSIFDYSKIFVYEEYFNPERALKFHRDNEDVASLFSKIEETDILTRNCYLKIFQPSQNPDNFNLLNKDRTIYENFLNALYNFQVTAGFDAITLPVLVGTKSTLQPDMQTLDYMLNKMNIGNSQIIPIVDLDYQDAETFQEIIRKITSLGNDLIPIVMLRHRKFKNSYWNYNAVKEFMNSEKTAFMYASINTREYDDTFSNTHSAEFLWGSIYSYRFRGGPHGKPKPKSETKFFRKNLDVKKAQEILGEHSKIETVGKSKYSNEITQIINNGLIDSIDHSTLNAFSRLHEHFLSNDELIKSIDFLKGSSVVDYANTKPKLKSHIRRLATDIQT
jgi:hypothetical protein